jgi:signal transduction histidine kinase
VRRAGLWLARLWRASLARRLVVLAAIWSIPVLVLTGAAQTTFFHMAALDRFDEDLLDVANGLYAGTSIDDQGQVDAPPLTDARATRAYSGKYWQIAEPAPGRLHALVRSRSLWDGELKGPPGDAPALEAAAGKPVYYDTVGPAREPLRAVALLARLQGRAAPVIFMAAADRRPVDTDAGEFAFETFGALIVVGLGLILAVFVQVRVGLRPLFDLRREVAAVRTGKEDRIEGDYPSELEPLAEELNALVAHDQEVVERQRTHVGNLAHALKTPLSVMLAEAAAHPGPLAEVVVRQADAMRDHVDHHLRRARAAARAQSQRERTPVAPVLEELSLTLERIFRDKRLEIDWRADDDLYFQGERHDFLEMVGNLLENAGKFSRGRVRVTARPSRPGRLTLVVDDDGAGLPADRREEVLKRGARLDESAPGSGLGLSIVDDLARAYGGGVTLGDSPMGGLQATLELPRAEI